MHARIAFAIAIAIATTFSLMTTLALAANPDLSFKAGSPGEYTFDTGQFSGRVAAGEKSGGLVSLIDKASGVELAKGNPQYGIFSFYRMLSCDQRWGTVFWEWPKQASVQPDGALRIDWPAAEDHPAKLSAVLRWSSPDTLDLEAKIVPQRDMSGLELFVGSYFKNDAKGLAYLASPRHAGGEPELMPVDVCPLTVGTYYAFPRDLKAAQLVYDGRWEHGLHPVQWSITRYLAAPLAVRRDEQTGMNLMLMSPGEDCFSIMCSYNQEPPDGVAGHYSTYLSLLGRDVKAGQTARARARLVVRKDVSADAAVRAYEQFVKESK